jgi:RNA polymerase sigma-70 factor, ECF subfamily
MPRRRLVVFLRYFADLSYAEIAEVLGVSEGTVAASLAQARAALRERLTEGAISGH